MDSLANSSSTARPPIIGNLMPSIFSMTAYQALTECSIAEYLQLASGVLSVDMFAVTVLGVLLCLVYVMKIRPKATSLLMKPRQYQPPQQVVSSAATNAKIKAKIDFLERNEEYYGYPSSNKGFIDEWRLREFPTLLPPLQLSESERNQQILSEGEPEVYLDYAGSALPTRSQLCRIYERNATHSRVTDVVDPFAEAQCNTQILANPHSLGGGLASDRSWKSMQKSIHCVMKHFGVDDEAMDLEEEIGNEVCAPPPPGYRLLFTSGATESLRLVADHFPWSCHNISPPINHKLVARFDYSSVPKRGADEQFKSLKVKSILVFPRNSHTSVIGMRNVAMSQGAAFHCVPADELYNASSAWFQQLVQKNAECEHKGTIQPLAEEEVDNFHDKYNHTIWVHNLLVLPVECNFSGDRCDWSNTVTAARSANHETFVTSKQSNASNCDTKEVIKVCHKWHVLLDTAKAAATSDVNLSTIVPGGPDFAICSFYKMFGSPTGIGALFIKKQGRKKRTHGKLENVDTAAQDDNHNATSTIEGVESMIVTNQSTRNYFGGGSVDIVLPHVDFTVKRNERMMPPNQFASKYYSTELIDLGALNNGTQNFRGINELVPGFREIVVVGGMSKISLHSSCLAAELVRRFNKLQHDNEIPVVSLYGQWKSYCADVPNSLSSFGPTVTFNVCDREGEIIGYDEVSRLASLNQPPIQLRTGCFCNPGACQDALMLSDGELIKNWREGHVCGDRRGIVNGKPTGCIRASFGKDSIWEDMDALASFIERVFASRRTQRIEGSCPVSGASQFAVDSIYVFPIKSCAAMQVNRWPIESGTGKLLFDREFALVDVSGVAMRLSAYPKMSQIQPIINSSTNTMTVSAPGQEDLILSLEKSEQSVVSSKDVEVCGILCTGNIWGGRQASNWFTSVLGVRCWLARHEKTSKPKAHPDAQTKHESYSNEAALLLVSQQSVNRLNSIIQNQKWGRLVDSRHFRPNIVVNTTEGLNESAEDVECNPEDSWERITISGKNGRVQLSAAGKCARCQMVDVDPSSGMKGNTLRALAQYRRDRGRIYFGTFFSGVKPTSDIESDDICIEVGDPVRTV